MVAVAIRHPVKVWIHLVQMVLKKEHVDTFRQKRKTVMLHIEMCAYFEVNHMYQSIVYWLSLENVVTKKEPFCILKCQDLIMKDNLFKCMSLRQCMLLCFNMQLIHLEEF